MKSERAKQPKELQKAISDREKRVELLSSFIVLAFSEGRKNLSGNFETKLAEAMKLSREQSVDPLIIEAGLFDSREMLLTSLLNGSYDPLARKLAKSLSTNYSDSEDEVELAERWFTEAVVTSGDSAEEQMEWLKNQTPDIWHVVLDGWNFDFALDWNWFAGHPELDAGTAVNLFIPSAESYLSGECHTPIYTALKIISERWIADDFKTSLYKISKDFSTSTLWRDEYFKTYDNLISEGKTPSFPRLDSLWSYEGTVEPITPYQQEHSIILQRYDLWFKSLKE